MELIHTLYQPAGSGPFPTVLTLHGRGANAMDLLGLAPYLGGGKFMVICPQGPLETPIGPDAVGCAWYPLSMGGPINTGAMMDSHAKLRAFLEACVKVYPVDTNKVALLGFSQGGVMAYSLALAQPQRFVALAALSTWLPKELLPQLNVSSAVQSLPTLVQHGTQDPLIEIDRARGSVEALRQMGVPLTFREYEMGHEIRPGSLSELSTWFEEKVLKTR